MIGSELRMAFVRVVQALGTRRDEFVFVGGAIRGLITNDPAAPPARPTKDLDVIVEAATFVDMIDVQNYLRVHGFVEDQTGPTCRWCLDDLVIDVMSTGGGPWGPSNRWYPSAIKESEAIDIGGGTVVRTISAVHFLATKLEAFASRGQGDLVASHDIEDVVAVIDGRESLLDELESKG